MPFYQATVTYTLCILYSLFEKMKKKIFFSKKFFSRKNFFFDKIFFCKFKKNLKNIRPKKFWHHFLASLTTKLNGPKFSYSKTRLIHRRRRLLRWSIFQRRLKDLWCPFQCLSCCLSLWCLWIGRCLMGRWNCLGF